MNSKTVLVTGGFGYVGSRLTPFLIDKGYQVKVIDLCLYGMQGLDALKNRKVEFIQDDIRNPGAVKEAMQGVDTVIHLAAISNDPTGEVDEILTRQVNFDSVGLLIANAKEAGVKRFINASSSSVFGIKKDSNITEQLEPEPLTYYSKYKMLSEWIVASSASPSFCTVNIRPATICGFSPRQRFDLTVNKLTADAVRKKIITVHGGEQRRPNVGMNDIIQLYSLLIETNQDLINGRTFNFGFENLKVIEIAELIQNQLNDLPIKINITPTLDQRDYHISSNKILEVLNYQPVSSIKKEIDELRESLESNYFSDIEASEYYNMKCMKLGQNASPYQYFAR